MVTIGQLLADAIARLGDSDSPRLDAELLLAHILEKPRTFLIAWPEHCPDAAQRAAFEQLLERRCGGEPIAYLLGQREFWSLPLKVQSGTLIPRPDTELLVEQSLALIREHGFQRIADLGTGSGAVALAIAHDCPACQVTATDIHTESLALARQNGDAFGLSNLDYRLGRWFAPLNGQRFDLIVSNPPYIAASDPHLQQGDVRFEPVRALVAGDDGLDDIREIVNQAPDHLIDKGWLLLEHGYEQGEAVRELLAQRGFGCVATFADLGGRERVSGGCCSR